IDAQAANWTALLPYSVSPFFLDHMVLPKPIMYWVTRTLMSVAGTKWPISGNAMDRAIPATMMRTPARAKTKVMGVLVEHDEQFDDGLQECVYLCLIVAMGSFLSAECHVADILETDMVFVLK